MSDVKEINYFSNEKAWRKGNTWYLDHFRNSNHFRVGEASTSYTSAPIIAHVPERIHRLLGSSVRLIYMVRHPVDRLVSHYLHRVHRGIETRALKDIVFSDQPEAMIWQGNYWFQIERYLEHFFRLISF